MYYVTKRMEISGSHQLHLSRESKCENLHGHNWIVTVYCKSATLDDDGMVVDFTEIKKKIHGLLDHSYLNDIFDFKPTAENIAYWVTQQIPHCYKCSVQESEGNIATYEVDE